MINETWDSTELAVKKVFAHKLDYSQQEIDSIAIERVHIVLYVNTHQEDTHQEDTHLKS